jgi:hypothetical protein
MFLKYDPYRVWCSIFYSKLVNCILLRSLFIFVKGRGTCCSGERNAKIWIDFRKSPRFSLTSPLSQERERSQVTLFLLCVVSPAYADPIWVITQSCQCTWIVGVFRVLPLVAKRYHWQDSGTKWWPIVATVGYHPNRLSKVMLALVSHSFIRIWNGDTGFTKCVDQKR